ncbi:MAG: IPT/TIG domain-containing protein [Chloroflexi bacterium]|nr:IPT/TIG domain-containing protein [Chloroflexota bacterium]
MNKRKLAWVSVFIVMALSLALLPGCGGGAGGSGTALIQQADNEVVFTPSPPIPPAAVPLGKYVPPSARVGDTENHTFDPGWNCMSFPFDSLTSTGGFTYYLYKWNGTTYQLIDPTDVGAINCTDGFWTYSDVGADVSGTGTYNESIEKIPLHAGWNFFAYPFRNPGAFAKISLTYNGETRRLADATSYQDSPGTHFAYAMIFTFVNGCWQQYRCDVGVNSFQPWYGYWIFSWHDDMTLNFGNPIVDAIDPSTARPLSNVTVLGHNFGDTRGTSLVGFSSGEGFTNSPSIASWSDTQIVCQVPLAPVTGPVVVTTTQGTSNNNIIFTVDPTPYINDINPPFGPFDSAVTINGINFGPIQDTGSVEFSGTASPSVTTWTTTQIVCAVPFGAVTGPVTVYAPTGKSNDFFFGITPHIVNIIPVAGFVGDTVTINGFNFGEFQGTSLLKFNSGVEACATVWSDTQIECLVPDFALTGPVMITTSFGTSNGVLFSLLPQITSLTPTSGPADTSVTITGAYFGAVQGTSVVKFNGASASNYTSWVDNEIVCRVPSGATTGPVTVITRDGTSNNDFSFTVTTPPGLPPSVGSINPSTGAIGTPVTIYGMGFGAVKGASTVRFYGIDATTITSWCSTRIECQVPTGAGPGPVIVTVDGIQSNSDVFFYVE